VPSARPDRSQLGRYIIEEFHMSSVLQGKVALVTGGSRGIGAAAARRLAADGAAVAISYVTSHDSAKSVVKELRAAGAEAAGFASDQADPAAARRLVADTVNRFGRIDILVNNAGVLVTGVIDDAERDHESFARQFSINVAGVAATTAAAAAHMGRGGRIISVGSSGAHHAPFPGIGDYVASKAALAAYTRAWSRDLGPRGITVNTVQLGAVDTEMSPDTESDAGQAMIAMTSLGRMGLPEEAAEVIAFLAGPGSAYMTGSVVTVDGGMTA
jgi:3-oxoacyl-[acyl-carrier protein] reductase